LKKDCCSAIAVKDGNGFFFASCCGSGPVGRKAHASNFLHQDGTFKEHFSVKEQLPKSLVGALARF
jgi:hypothetical protein